MSRVFLALLLAVAAALAAETKTAVDLMLEGRFREAKVILDTTNASPRYHMLLQALTEADAARACSLYRAVSRTYPETDCDSVAQERLHLAQEMGFRSAWPETTLVAVATSAEPLTPKAAATGAPTPPKTEQPASPTPPEVGHEVTLPAVSLPAVPAVLRPALPEAEVTEARPAETKPEALPLTREPKAAAPTSSAETENIPVTPTEAKAPEPRLAEGIPATTPEHETTKVTEAKSAAVPAPGDSGFKDEEIVVDQAKSDPNLVTPPTQTPEPKLAATIPELVAKPEQVSAGKEATVPAPKSNPSATDEMQKKERSEKTTGMAEPAGGHWFVQVGAFGKEDNAYRLAAKLRTAGYKVVLVPRQNETISLLQVRVGGYATRDEGRAAADKLKSDFSLPAVLISQ